MGSQSGFLRRQADIMENRSAQIQLIVKQFMLDTLQITLHKEYGWGYDRLSELADKWKEARDEYFPALDAREMESDVCRVHMDQAFADICGDCQPVIPFEDRYPDLKKVRYDIKFKERRK